jgi:hypothetical protein
MAMIPSLASFPGGKLSNSVAQIQMNLPSSCNADCGQNMLKTPKLRHI